MIEDNLNQLKNSIPPNVKLIAVSKTKPTGDILAAYNTGHRDFGENKVQELTDKWEELPKDIRWHLIGHLQRNKVKYIAPFVHLIHAVDSLRLLKEINKQALKCDRIIRCLLQFHIAEESTKYGLTGEEARELLESREWSEMKNVRIVGVMGMATFTTDNQQIAREFNGLTRVFNELAATHFKDQDDFTEISMGMSGDYPMAIACGSTMIRVGSKIFGERNYP